MGKGRRWNKAEVDALIAGVKKHGSGDWVTILNDPEFAPILSLRNNVSLKDKWRNLSNDAQGSTSGKPSELEALRAELKCLREELKQIKDERACLQKQVKDLTEEAAKYKELKSLLRMYLNG